jgi:hypothetical protein
MDAPKKRFERNYDDMVPTIEFCNISAENKDFCLKKAKEAMSKYTYVI